MEPGAQDSDVARCPGHLHAYSGGSQGATETDSVMNSSFPVDRGDPDQAPDDGWAVFVDNSGSERVRIRITVACGKRMPRYATESAQVLGNTQNGTVMTCEAPKRFLYGGGQVNSGGFEDIRVITASVGISAAEARAGDVIDDDLSRAGANVASHVRIAVHGEHVCPRVERARGRGRGGGRDEGRGNADRQRHGRPAAAAHPRAPVSFRLCSLLPHAPESTPGRSAGRTRCLALVLRDLHAAHALACGAAPGARG